MRWRATRDILTCKRGTEICDGAVIRPGQRRVDTRTAIEVVEPKSRSHGGGLERIMGRVRRREGFQVLAYSAQPFHFEIAH